MNNKVRIANYLRLISKRISCGYDASCVVVESGVGGAYFVQKWHNKKIINCLVRF